MSRNTRLRWAALVAGVALVLAGCSSTGGKQAEESADNAVGAGKADTPKITIAMVTHGAPGDTFWDIIRKGAQAAAAKDNVDFKYSVRPRLRQAGDAHPERHRQQGRRHRGHPARPAGASRPAVKKAIAAGIPVVAFNAGIGQYAESGALAYFGSDESLAGETGGTRATEDGFKHMLCVVQVQGQVQLEARCAGVAVHVQGQVREDLRQRLGPAVGAVHDRREAEAGPEHRLRASRSARRSR